MSDRRDPVDAAADGRLDLYDIARWEPRTLLDRLSIGVHAGLLRTARGVVILAALLLLLAQFALTGLATLRNPVIGGFVLLSIVPALGLAAFVWLSDVTRREPLDLLVTTFLLGVLFASFAAIVNTLAQELFQLVPVVGLALFYFLVVGPIEETVKWLAIRLHAYRSDSFDAVIDGAVYGAVAGLGFATIENLLYIGVEYRTALEMAAISPVNAALPTAAVRSFAGPGHVIFSAFAGYYLGLAKFNREQAGPIVVKGLIIAAGLHALYNTTVSYLPEIVAILGISLSPAASFLGFVILFDGIAGLWLFRKINRYRGYYRSTGASSVPPGEHPEQRTLDSPEWPPSIDGSESDDERPD